VQDCSVAATSAVVTDPCAVSLGLVSISGQYYRTQGTNQVSLAAKSRAQDILLTSSTCTEQL
jgi:hypothetical protein